MKTGNPTTTEAREILAARFVHLPNDAKDILAGEHVMLPSSWAVNAVIAALNLRDEARSLALEALQPFAAVADEYDDGEDDWHEVWTDRGSLLDKDVFQLKYYRAARAAIRALGKDGL